MGGDQAVEEQVVVDNLQKDEEETKAEREKEKEEAEDRETNLIRRQVVQNDGATQTDVGGIKTAKPAINQAVLAQNVTVQRGAGTGNGLFSKVKFAVNFDVLPEKYKRLGTLIEEYGNLEDSRQGGDTLKAKLVEIQDLAESYLNDTQIKKKSKNIRVGTIKEFARTTINRIDKGENVLPQNEQQQEPRRTTGQLPMPRMKPAAQKTLPPVPPKPYAQKPLPPVPPKPYAQKPLPPVPPKSYAQKPLPPIPTEVTKTEEPPNVTPPEETQTGTSQPQQQSVPAEPVVQEIQQSQTETQTEETQQSQAETSTGETQQSQAETNTEGTQQQEETSNEEQQQPPQQQPQTPELAGPSMRKDFLDMMKAEVETGGTLINPGYKDIVARFEQLNTLLGETITEKNQKENWEKLQEAYGWLAAVSEQYAKAHAVASPGVGRECRKHARMLLFMCKADMNTLRIAIRDNELAKKNATWRQILEQPAAAPTTQQTTTQDAAQTNHQNGDPARDFQKWRLVLSSSEKGGIGWNSKYYNRVKAALEQTAKVMEQGFSRDRKDNMRKLSEAAAALQALQAACQEYTARNPRTENGKIRRDIVLQIQNFAAKDVIGCQKAISDFIGMAPEDQAKENWMSVIRKARSVQLTVDDFSQLGKASGGQASEVFKIESQEGDRTVTKYFKKEDSLDVSAGAGKENPLKHMALQAAFKQFPKLSKQDKEDLKQLLTVKNNSELPDFSEEAKEAYEFYLDYTNKHLADVGELMAPLGIVDEGGNANMSRRNVATSRMAELLGLGNLVAKSQTVDILDKATGQTVHGNLMEQAEGTDFDQIKDRLEEKKVKSGFIRDTMNLQVLDMLCGQVDRHGNNLFYKTDGKGNVTGVQGIDNDASFGTNTDAVSSQKHAGQRKDARLFDVETGDMIIPYMDKQLADRIEALDSQMVRYVLSDLLKKEEIDAAIRRLEVTKAGIKKAKEKHSDRFLEKEEDWTMEGVGENLLNNYNQELRLSRYHIEAVKELYKDDPKMVQGITLLVEHGLIFKKLYSEERQKEIREALQNVNDYLNQKHWGNRNYFGRLMSWNKPSW